MSTNPLFTPTTLHHTVYDLPEGHPTHPNTLRPCVIIGGPLDGSIVEIVNQLKVFKHQEIPSPNQTLYSSSNAPAEPSKVPFHTYKRLDCHIRNVAPNRCNDGFSVNAFIHDSLPEEGIKALGLVIAKACLNL